MVVHLVRHADAGQRNRWDGPDDARPLSDAGRRRAEELRAELVPSAPHRILSSPFVRCMETVQPLADALGLVVEPHPALAEGASIDRTWDLLESLAGAAGVVLCSHGDVIPPLLERMQRRGVTVRGPGTDVAKGSVWTVEPGAEGRLAAAHPTSAP